MRNNLTWLGLLIGIISLGCNRNTVEHDDKKRLPFEISCIDYASILDDDGADSEIGTVFCDGIKLQYDYGRYSNDTPISIFESFQKQFYAYHYSNFFEAIYLEEKLRDVLKDSIAILSAIEGKIDGRYILECEVCDGTATLSFNDTEFLFPFNTNDVARGNHEKYKITIENLPNQMYKKTYISKQKSGILIAPKGSRSNSRGRARLSINTSTDETVEVEKILSSISLKNSI